MKIRITQKDLAVWVGIEELYGGMVEFDIRSAHGELTGQRRRLYDVPAQWVVRNERVENEFPKLRAGARPHCVSRFSFVCACVVNKESTCWRFLRIGACFRRRS